MSPRTKPSKARSFSRSFTLIELLAILAIIVLAAVVLLPSLRKAKEDQARSKRIKCVIYLKQIALGFRIFATDHTNRFPMALSTNLGGAKEYVPTPQTFRFFQVMSNELTTPIVTICPADTRRPATNFHGHFSNSKVSYFVGLDAGEAQPQMLLVGDRNLTSSIPLTNWILELRPGAAAGWTRAMHRYAGNVALADGSVQQVNSTRLQQQVLSSGTNRLALPE